jgi:hypothetical protein
MDVQRARLSDLPWIRELAAEASLAPAYRQGDAQKATRDRLAHLETSRLHPDLKLVVAGERQGFALVHLAGVEDATGQPQAELLELAARSDEALEALVDEAARMAHRRGLEHLAWRLPNWSEELLERAEHLGFLVERCEILMECSPAGPVKSWPTDPALERLREGR